MAVIYKIKEIEKLSLNEVTKVFGRWFNEESNRIKQRKIYSACMNQFIKICKQNGYIDDFDKHWKKATKNTHYGGLTESKKVVKKMIEI